MSRIVLSCFTVAVALAAAVALTTATGVAAEGEPSAKKPCTIATKGDSPVAKACAQGGLAAAKSTMKDLVKRAKASGTKFDCDECHSDDKKYTLTDDAKDKFAKLMAAAEGKK